METRRIQMRFHLALLSQFLLVSTISNLLMRAMMICLPFTTQQKVFLIHLAFQKTYMERLQVQV